MPQARRDSPGRLLLWVAAALAESALAQMAAALFLGLFAPRALAPGLPPLPALLLVYLLGARYGRTWGAPSRAARRQVSVQAGVGAVVAGILAVALHGYWQGGLGGLAESPVALMGFFSGWYLWWQGVVAGVNGVAQTGPAISFGGRSATLLVFLLLAALTGKYLPPGFSATLYRQAVLFFAGALSLLAWARLEEVRRLQRAGDEARDANAMGLWMSGLALALVLVATVADPALLTGAASVVARPVLAALSWVLVRITAGLVWLLSPISDLIDALRARAPEPRLEVELPQAPAESLPLRLDPRWPLPALDLSILKWVGLLLLAAAMVYGIRRWRYRVSGPLDANEEEYESLGFWSMLWSDVRAGLAAMLTALRRRLRSARGRATVDAAGTLAAGPEEPAVRDVRAAFRQLQRIGRRRGRPRRAHQTPTEYGRRVAEVLPGARRPLATLVELYNRVRYGPSPEAETAAAARAALAEIETADRNQP